MVNQYCAHSFTRNWQPPFLNQQKGENDRRKYFMINLHERMLLTLAGLNLWPPGLLPDAHPTEPPRPTVTCVYLTYNISYPVLMSRQMCYYKWLGNFNNTESALELGRIIAIIALSFCHIPQTCNIIIGIKHGFSCINIRQVPREVLKTEAGGLNFQQLPRDLANVNAL